jgi:hypothetical protein
VLKGLAAKFEYRRLLKALPSPFKELALTDSELRVRAVTLPEEIKLVEILL